MYLTIEGIDHSRTQAYHPQTNGICERFHKTIQEEFYNVAFRTKIYKSIEELQHDLDEWLEQYNTQRTHQGKHCDGKTPMECFGEGKKLAQEKEISQQFPQEPEDAAHRAAPDLNPQKVEG